LLFEADVNFDLVSELGQKPLGPPPIESHEGFLMAQEKLGHVPMVVKKFHEAVVAGHPLFHNGTRE